MQESLKELMEYPENGKLQLGGGDSDEEKELSYSELHFTKVYEQLEKQAMQKD